jgi:hypothetical protein
VNETEVTGRKLCERQYEEIVWKYTLLNIEYVMAFRD